MSHNLIMVDFAAKDQRSASAMLRGTGDGREALWLSYEESHLEIFDKIYLMESFEYKVRRELINTKISTDERILNKYLLLILGLLFVLL